MTTPHGGNAESDGSSKSWPWLGGSGRTSASAPDHASTLASRLCRLGMTEAELDEDDLLETLGHGLTHALNGQLQTILSSAHAVTRMTHLREARQPLQCVTESAEALAILSAQLTAITDRSPLPTRACDLGTWLGTWRPLLCAASLESTALTLELPSTTVGAMVSPGAAQDALLQLVCNAGESNATHVAVRCDTMSLRDALGADVIGDMGDRMLAYIEVEDDGTGISPSDLRHVFQPFFSTKGAGRGLGLPFALTCMRRGGGGISIESAASRGTRVRLLFPSCRADQVPRDPDDGRESLSLR